MDAGVPALQGMRARAGGKGHAAGEKQGGGRRVMGEWCGAWALGAHGICRAQVVHSVVDCVLRTLIMCRLTHMPIVLLCYTSSLTPPPLPSYHTPSCGASVTCCTGLRRRHSLSWRSTGEA
jgi:hypothetical protein